MEDESLVAQVPCEPGVVTTAIPREVPGGAGALWTWVSDYSCTQRGDIYVWRWRILLDKVLTWCFRYLVRPVAMTKAIRWEVTWTIFMVYEVKEFFGDIGPSNVWVGMILRDIVAMKTSDSWATSMWETKVVSPLILAPSLEIRLTKVFDRLKWKCPGIILYCYQDWRSRKGWEFWNKQETAGTWAVSLWRKEGCLRVYLINVNIPTSSYLVTGIEEDV